jgi:hypothetical protein
MPKSSKTPAEPELSILMPVPATVSAHRGSTGPFLAFERVVFWEASEAA